MLNKEEYIELIKKCYNQTVYIYGAGKMAKIIYSLCKENNVEVKGFLLQIYQKIKIRCSIYQFYNLILSRKIILSF